MGDIRDDRTEERVARLIEAALDARLTRGEFVRRGLGLGLGLPLISAALAACGLEPPAAGTVSRWQPTPTLGAPPAPALSGSFQPAQPTPGPEPAQAELRFAVIGDYGLAGNPAAAVAALVAGWAPDFVLTLGDNNYPDGLAATIDANVGQYYAAFIGNYQGAYGPGSAEPRFFPVLGNHDWVPGYPDPYLSYFNPPGNGRYYTLERGPVALFCLDSMPGEPDGIDADSVQGRWLEAALGASTAPWKIVVMHHAPFSSGYHGGSAWMQWPFAQWGAQLVLAGHDHTYERIERDGVVYVVNGLGGGARYAPGFFPAEGSRLFFNADHGAMIVTADRQRLGWQFITQAGQVVDTFWMSVSAKRVSSATSRPKPEKM